MKNLNKIILISFATAIITGNSFLVARTDYLKKKNENLEKYSELSDYKNLAISYFDSSAQILQYAHNQVYTANPKLIKKLNLSLDYLEKTDSALNSLMKESKNYPPYKDNYFGWDMEIERLDTPEVKRKIPKIKELIPKIKELKETELTLLKNANKINSSSIQSLYKKHLDVYSLIVNHLR